MQGAARCAMGRRGRRRRAHDAAGGLPRGEARLRGRSRSRRGTRGTRHRAGAHAARPRHGVPGCGRGLRLPAVRRGDAGALAVVGGSCGDRDGGRARDRRAGGRPHRGAHGGARGVPAGRSAPGRVRRRRERRRDHVFRGTAGTAPHGQEHGARAGGRFHARCLRRAARGHGRGPDAHLRLCGAAAACPRRWRRGALHGHGHNPRPAAQGGAGPHRRVGCPEHRGRLDGVGVQGRGGPRPGGGGSGAQPRRACPFGEHRAGEAPAGNHPRRVLPGFAGRPAPFARTRAGRQGPDDRRLLRAGAYERGGALRAAAHQVG